MSQTPPGFTLAEHNWHSSEYVDKWIARDVTREERPPTLRQMLSLAAFPPDAAIKALDVGGGNGLVTEMLLEAFPKARVTLQDYSQPMLDRARERFARFGDQVTYSLSDLFDPAWAAAAGGPFDLVVSSIALHNLATMEAITAAYKGIHGLLVPGGQFLDCDHLTNIGGISAHLDALKAVGFSKVECVNENKPQIVAAQK